MMQNIIREYRAEIRVIQRAIKTLHQHPYYNPSNIGTVPHPVIQRLQSVIDTTEEAIKLSYASIHRLTSLPNVL